MRGFVMTALVAAVAVMVLPQPTLADCQIVECHDQCWQVPGGRRCQRRCLRRCWQPAPRYVPPAAPHYYAPPQNYSASIDLDLFPLAAGAALILGIIAVIIGGITSATSTNAHEGDIEQIERDMTADNDVKASMEDAMRKADAHIAAMLEKYRKGDDHD